LQKGDGFFFLHASVLSADWKKKEEKKTIGGETILATWQSFRPIIHVVKPQPT